MATHGPCDDASIDPLDAGHPCSGGSDVKTSLGYPGSIHRGLCCCMDALCVCSFPGGYADPFHSQPLGVVLSPFQMDWYDSVYRSGRISMEHTQTTVPVSMS